jgi:quercetin dioxygenase-like cupin family protein
VSGGSRVLPFTRFRWEGVEVHPYKAEGGALFKDVTRQTLLGEAPGEEALSVITRYFEILPGGHSTMERHRHPHVVVVIRGTGEVVLDGAAHRIAPFDCVYVAPGAVHQFRATGDKPLGFLCIVDRERDRPEAVEP